MDTSGRGSRCGWPISAGDRQIDAGFCLPGRGGVVWPICQDPFLNAATDCLVGQSIPRSRGGKGDGACSGIGPRYDRPTFKFRYAPIDANSWRSAVWSAFTGAEPVLIHDHEAGDAAMTDVTSKESPDRDAAAPGPAAAAAGQSQTPADRPAMLAARIRRSFLASVGSIVFGMEDGTVSIFGLAFGVAVSAPNSRAVLLAGGTGAVAAAVSMMAGTFLDVESTNDQAAARVAD